ncbi:RimJ/RimL family protein N-acetyltransferase [Undibacterium sp. GrIS 1.8]|uniref:GNAT family N-acetyltransferase n=1 Tax=unclassified Undibacterium TaxID=2630295 RepID=UPI00339599DC
MTNTWIQHPVHLLGEKVELCPLEADQLDELFKVACNPEIWKQTSVDYSNPEIFYPNFNAALSDRNAGKAYPFLIVDLIDSRIIGTTRLLEIHSLDKKLEVGITWIDTAYWGTGVNLECKFLLLQYCFEHLLANRVQFRAKADNTRSRKALEKIGAIFEGIQRKDKIEPNGKPRNTAFYSITNDEWLEVKSSLTDKIQARYALA